MSPPDPLARYAVLVRGVVKHMAETEASAVRIAQQASQGETGVVAARRVSDGAIVWTSEGGAR